MTFALTQRQAACLAFLRTHFAEHGAAPSCEEIAAGIGLSSKSGVVRLLNDLEERGHIRRLRSRKRAIELIAAPNVIDLASLTDQELRTFGERLSAEIQRRAA